MKGALASSRPGFNAGSASPHGRRLRLMIVDDSMVARAVLSRMVETDGGFEIAAVAGTAEDAIEALGQVRDVVVAPAESSGQRLDVGRVGHVVHEEAVHFRYQKRGRHRLLHDDGQHLLAAQVARVAQEGFGAGVVLPLHYSYALLSQVCCQLTVGGHVHLFAEMRNPLKVARVMNERRLETLCGVPSTFSTRRI